MASSDVSPSKLPGPPRPKIIEKKIETVRNLVEEKPNSSISEVLTAINLSTGTVLKILWKTLIKYPYIPKTVQSLTDQLKLCRVQFYNWILQQNEEFCFNIMWSDKKLWTEKQHPNKQSSKITSRASLNKYQIITAVNDPYWKSR